MTKSNRNLSLTPQKRQPQIQSETPTKKRRVCIYLEYILIVLEFNENILSS